MRKNTKIVGEDKGKPKTNNYPFDIWYYEGSVYKIGINGWLFRLGQKSEWFRASNDKKEVCTSFNLIAK